MRLPTLLRISPAIWFSFVLILIAVWTANVATPNWSDPYALALTSAGSSSIFVVAPFCAACSAWEGDRLRRANWVNYPHMKNFLSIALHALYPTIIVGIIAISTAIFTKYIGLRIFIIPDYRPLIVAIGIIIAHSLIGFIIGIYISSVIAVPTVLIIDYIWMALPRANQPYWLRHLTGSWDSCCDIYTNLAPQVFLANILIILGSILCAFLILYISSTKMRFFYALIPVIVSYAISIDLVSSLGPLPVIPRDSSELVCSSTQPRICVWPEHESRLGEVTTIALAAADRWHDAGMKVPEEFSEWYSLQRGDRGFGFSKESKTEDIINALAYSSLPSIPSCAFETSHTYHGYKAETLIRAWLLSIMNIPIKNLEDRFGLEIANQVLQVHKFPINEQKRWLDTNLNLIKNCDTLPEKEHVS